MSSEAVDWAFRQDICHSALKFTLIALCHCANYRTGRIMPSIAYLCELTGQNRKTIIANVARLERMGLLEDTGAVCGKTNQIKVYRLPKLDPGKPDSGYSGKGPENDVKQSRNRDSEPSLEPSVSQTSDEVCASTAENLTVPALLPEHVAEVWNELAGRLGRPKINGITPERRSKLKTLIAQYTLEDFKAAFVAIEQSPLLRGDRNNWGCTFDWMIKRTNFQKIIEGNYRD